MPAHNRTPDERLRDRAEVARLYLSGMTQVEIAAQLGKTRSLVSYDLAMSRKEWLASATRDVGQQRAEELAKLFKIETEAWAAWEHSKMPLESSIDETIDDEVTMPSGTRHGRVKQPRTRTRHATRTQAGHGDPTFLQIALRCSEQRCRILGLNAAQDLTISGTLSFGDLWAIANGNGHDARPPLHLLPVSCNGEGEPEDES